MKQLVRWIASASILLTAACGSSTDIPPIMIGGDTTTTAQSSPATKGASITEPVCDFVGMTPEAATALLGFGVTTTSDVGDKDPSGGSCKMAPTAPAADSFEVEVAVFPDTADGFQSFIQKFTTDTSKTGRLLWTAPERIPGIGESAYTFRSPDGGYDNVWVFTDGYRIMLTDQNKTDVPGAPAKLQQVATAAAANVGGT